MIGYFGLDLGQWAALAVAVCAAWLIGTNLLDRRSERLEKVITVVLALALLVCVVVASGAEVNWR